MTSDQLQKATKQGEQKRRAFRETPPIYFDENRPCFCELPVFSQRSDNRIVGNNYGIIFYTL